jgi:DNA-3-methyladenine glycosylase II
MATKLKEAELHLAKADERMKALIQRIGPCPPLARSGQEFDVLASSVVSQQLSSAAAGTIKSRLVNAINGPRPFRADKFANINIRSLRACGLSVAKSECLRLLARSVASGEITTKRYRSLDDEFVIQELVQYRGIGRWTAEMFLIFGLGRQDVLALADAGLRRAATSIYGLRRPISESRFASIGAQWRPYRSIASWYLWRHLD